MIKEAIDSYYVRMVLTYDGIDNLLTYKDDHQEVEYGYEGMWKLTRRKDARGVICFLHDREERLLEIINEKGEHYAFGMDAAGILPEGEILPLIPCSPMMHSEEEWARMPLASPAGCGTATCPCTSGHKVRGAMSRER